MQSIRCHYLPLCRAGPTVEHAQRSRGLQARKSSGPETEHARARPNYQRHQQKRWDST